MNCPRCGHELVEDNHRKIPLLMCYNCGYMEGRNMGPELKKGETNFDRLKKLSFNEMASFLSTGLGTDLEETADFLDSPAE